MAPPADPVAALDGVTHRYGAVAALDDVSVSIPAGRMVGLIGPDGVGKSTFLALIAGVRRLQTGTVAALGRPEAPRRGLPAHRLHAAGVGPQSLSDAFGL